MLARRCEHNPAVANVEPLTTPDPNQRLEAIAGMPLAHLRFASKYDQRRQFMLPEQPMNDQGYLSSRPREGGSLVSGRGDRWLDRLASILLVSASIAVLWQVFGGTPTPSRQARPAVPVPASPVTVEGAVLLGSTKSAVTMVVFSDFQCPFCQRLATQVLPTLKSELVDTGVLSVAFRHLPLRSIHPNAALAAQFSECAKEAGHFWTAHDLLFSRESLVASANWRTLWQELGQDVEKGSLETCLNSEPLQVKSDEEQATQLGIKSTPTALIGKRNPDGTLSVFSVISGAMPVADYRRAIDEVRRNERQ